MGLNLQTINPIFVSLVTFPKNCNAGFLIHQFFAFHFSLSISLSLSNFSIFEDFRLSIFHFPRFWVYLNYLFFDTKLDYANYFNDSLVLKGWIGSLNRSVGAIMSEYTPSLPPYPLSIPSQHVSLTVLSTPPLLSSPLAPSVLIFFL